MFHRYWSINEDDIGWSLWSLQLISGIPELLERELFYIVAFSSALAVLNAVPCFKLDGQHIVKAFIEELEIPCLTKERVSRNRSTIRRNWRATASNILMIFGTFLLISNVLLGCSKAFGFIS